MCFEGKINRLFAKWIRDIQERGIEDGFGYGKMELFTDMI